VGPEPFVVLLGDEFVEEERPLLPAMIDMQARTGGIVLAFLEVDPSETNRYGIASVDRAAPDLVDALVGIPAIGDVFRVTGLIEKPPTDKAPSNLAVVGRYVLPPEIFDAIRRIKPGAGGEIQLTDAMALLLAEGVPVHGIVYRGTRYDTGLPLGYLQAVVQIATQRADLGPPFVKWLKEYVQHELLGTPSD
jgi:UTP--glucose-1-phosphate uridylyltransferase